MNPVDMDELEALIKAATPGPWSVPHFAEPAVNCKCAYVLSDVHMGAVCTVHASGEGNWQVTGDDPKFDEACANARLIAAAPTAIAGLILALRELKARVEGAPVATVDAPTLFCSLELRDADARVLGLNGKRVALVEVPS